MGLVNGASLMPNLLCIPILPMKIKARQGPELEERIRRALATPGRPGVRVIAKQFGVDPGAVRRISRPFVGSAGATAA
jgi:hypothetical protein